MKEVGIATFHFADNYGAVLQCYALQKVINRFEGVHAKIIDYRPPEFRYAKVWTSEREKLLFQKKRQSFEHFLVQHCELSPQRVSVITGEECDYCCVGSDQIWNPTHVFEEYFLPNVSSNICKIAYAPSIGCSVADAKSKESVFAKYLPSFKAISLREKEHVEYLSDIAGKKCECVLDPTLLLNPEDYFPILSRKTVGEEEPYLLFYWLKNDRELFRGMELANSIARKFNLKILHSVVGAKESMFYQGGECIYYTGIEEFLWYIKNASFVVTNSYHGTIFSLQFEVPFYSFVVKSMMSRFSTLMSYCDLKDRVVTKLIRIGDVSKDIDYKRMKIEIFRHRAESIDYLKKALDIV